MISRLILLEICVTILVVAFETPVCGFLTSTPNPTKFYRSISFTNLELKKGGKKKKKVNDGTIAVNRTARRNYEIVETMDAGISLLGSEVKSIRDGKMNIRDGFVRPERNGRSCTLMNVHIGKHTMSSEYFQHEERRPRPLLLRKEEARKMLQQVERKGMTIVPLKAYFNDKNLVKVQIGLCRGKNVRDKRQDIKDRDAKKEAERMVKNFRLN
mmetsp:Transcript_18551/g.26104  ORF Transcript_18551/g.26104 Transcript_18551/m.26104 type:complete len:213 (-) Transcript_18551:109-747(-)|eukprot:CAMPEP_0184857612 /NCGR_PEP_ID=MMETSP0580-20130426/2767_1 /TAXON_ID=1118495 /ORGANISM="Dactyliosolen fragilissimus" /LENGTH=212 /DNA_ID=CAMNT_0027353313 /DNA_START=11 /DNA_END=649 /DNA_ORIENTATION=-